MKKSKRAFGEKPPGESPVWDGIPLLGGKYAKILANPWAIDAFCVK
jgi:hypothetical protein